MSHYLLHLEKAREYYDDGNYDGARAAAAHALACALPGEGSEARMIAAMSLRKLEFHDDAFRLLYEIVCTTPTPQACAEYALMCAERGQCDANCRDMATNAAQLMPDLPSSYLALFWCDVTDGLYLQALQNLKRGLFRGGEFPASRAFEMVRQWCQEACDLGDPKFAYDLVNEIADFFATFDFLVLQARLAEICQEHRQAVAHYKRALNYLRPGSLRTEILEAIARIAV